MTYRAELLNLLGPAKIPSDPGITVWVPRETWLGSLYSFWQLSLFTHMDLKNTTFCVSLLGKD